MRTYTTRRINDEWLVVRRCANRAEALDVARTLNGEPATTGDTATDANTQRLADAEAQARKSRA